MAVLVGMTREVGEVLDHPVEASLVNDELEALSCLPKFHHVKESDVSDGHF